MNTLVVGTGECGRNIVLQMYYQLSSMRYKYLIRNFDFFVTDIEDSLRVIGDIKRKGIPAEVINPEKHDERIKPLNVFMLSPKSSQSGVGGAWRISSQIASNFFQKEEGVNKKYIDLLNLPIQYCECFNIFNSAGGGTGSGSGPVFLEYLLRSAQDPSRKLFTATIVFPFKKEGGNWRDLNTAINISRYSRLCDSIIIADNEFMEDQIRSDVKTVQNKINELLGNIWMWINACSSPQLNVSPKRWEGADFKRNFKLGTKASLIVPCFREEPAEKLRRITLKWIVLRTIRENCAAKCLPETSKRILIMASLPDTDGCPASESDVADYINNELFKGKGVAIDVIFIRGKTMHNVSVTVLLISPEIPRLEELNDNFRAYLENPDIFEKDMVGQIPKNSQEDLMNYYKVEYENFQKYLYDLKNFT